MDLCDRDEAVARALGDGGEGLEPAAEGDEGVDGLALGLVDLGREDLEVAAGLGRNLY